MDRMAEIRERVRWWQEARFGMFIHWGLYSIPASGEWVMSEKEMTVEEYHKYFELFNPVDYDPKKWVRAAKRAGMKYIVLTAKHHDGFCLFDTAYTEYKSTNTKIGRDLVKEFVEACREEDIRVGIYFSLIDWSHPDFPKYGDRQHPMRNNAAYKNEKINFDNYLTFMHNQVREIVTNYGKLDLLWFDFSYDELCGEKWKATDLINMVRKYQPDVIIDNRLEGSGEDHGSLVTGKPTVYSGDFVSPEQIIPTKGVTDINGNLLPWELCATMNNHWGYCNYDFEFKPAEMIIRKLVECVSKGGNFILNLGPDARGNIPNESLDILGEIGEWMDKNSESIYGCGQCALPKPEWGRYTSNGDTIYAHVFEAPLGALPLTGVNPKELVGIYYLSNGSE
ncbi:MAG: alpha-L-fucosidase, partial [Lachnospiraceae bacterium]|nr:alpha-L-fucosidase [Lachnospiraceae bacterium]